MNWNTLDSIDWDDVETTADWVKILNDLRGLIDSADNPVKRDQLAAKLDEFADHSNSDDLNVIIKLDASARKSAQALRSKSISESIATLAAASAEFQAVVKEFAAATVSLKKEASLLRGEKFIASVSSLTETITALKNLSQVITSDDDHQLGAAIAQTVQSAQKLRGILEATPV